MKEVSRSTLLAAGVLLLFTLVGTTLLALAYSQTRGPIAKSEEESKLKLIRQLLPHSLYDNHIVHDTIKLKPSPLLGEDDDSIAYVARLKGKPTAVVLESIAPDGYGGAITMLVAIKADGEIAGVRVVEQNETPGLGDYIDIAKSDWIKIFDGTSLAGYSAEDWHVKKDGGKFDYMTGATISPRAVVKAVHKALQYFAANRAKLLPAQKQNTHAGDAKRPHHARTAAPARKA